MTGADRLASPEVPSLHSLGWQPRAPAPQRSSVELVSTDTWTVSRVWSTGGTLDARPLPAGTTRVLVGVDGAAVLRSADSSGTLSPKRMILLDATDSVSMESENLWAWCEWHLRTPALTQRRVRQQHRHALPLAAHDYALVTAMTNVISTRSGFETAGGGNLLLETLAGVTLASLTDAADEHTALSPLQTEIVRRARATIERRYSDPSFDVSALASGLHLSGTYLRRIFAMLGTTPREAIEERRVRAAESFLSLSARGRGALTDAARATGFSSAERLQAALDRHRRRHPSTSQRAPE